MHRPIFKRPPFPPTEHRLTDALCGKEEEHRIWHHGFLVEKNRPSSAVEDTKFELTRTRKSTPQVKNSDSQMFSFVYFSDLKVHMVPTGKFRGCLIDNGCGHTRFVSLDYVIKPKGRS